MTVVIENDEKIEETESFSATLERTPDLDDRILLSPVDTTISIIDDDGKCWCIVTYTNQLQLTEHYLKTFSPQFSITGVILGQDVWDPHLPWPLLENAVWRL